MELVHEMDDGIRSRCERGLRAWLRDAATIRLAATMLLAGRATDPDAAAAWDDRMAELRTGRRPLDVALEAPVREGGSMPRLPAALFAATALALAAPPAASTAPPSPDPDAFTPIMQKVLARPAPVLGSDGRHHVVFEVQALNASSLPWTVRRVAIRAAGSPRGRVLARWSGRAVRDVLVSLGDREPTRRLQPGQGAVFHIAFSARSRRALPTALVQELRLRNASRPMQGPPKVTQASTATRLVQRRPARLGAPLQGSRWVAADGCCTAHRHVWATQPYGGALHTAQRFAIDWERLDEQGRLFVGDRTRLENWTGYGESLLAVGDGRIVHAVDGLPNQVPGQAVGITPATADGNGVILRLHDGRFVSYAHMIPGSVTVKVGDRVSAGQRLGALGNSGNSSAPHLHLHVTDRNAIFGANGLPYTFDRFKITGRVASTAAFDAAEASGDPVQTGPVRVGPRRHMLSLDQVIVTWP